MENGTDKFMKHFKVPKAEIKRIQKEYRDSKITQKQVDETIEDKLRDFEDDIQDIFRYYRVITGERRINEEAMKPYVAYWLDEGFETIDMKDYMSSERESDYYRENPQHYTLKYLFPKENQDRINRVFDAIAWFQCLRMKPDKARPLLQIPCPWTWLKKRVDHFIPSTEQVCEECIKDGFEPELLLNPYRGFEYWKERDAEKAAFCACFMRQGIESMEEYAERTKPLRIEAYDRNGIPHKLRLQ